MMQTDRLTQILHHVRIICIIVPTVVNFAAGTFYCCVVPALLYIFHYYAHLAFLHYNKIVHFCNNIT